VRRGRRGANSNRSRVTAERVEHLRQAQSLTADLERVRGEADAKRVAFSESLEQRRTFEAMTQVLADQLKAASAEKENLSEQVKELREEAARSKHELDRVRAQAAAERSRTAAEVAAERAERQQLLETLKLETERVRAEADADVDRTRREAETRLDEHNRVRQHLETHIGQLQHELVATRHDARQLSALETQVRHVRDEAAEMIAERDRRIDLLNANYARIINSDSWRVTLPLRKAGALLPPKARARLRWIPKSVYWLLTPHKIPARLHLIRGDRSSNPACSRACERGASPRWLWRQPFRWITLTLTPQARACPLIRKASPCLARSPSERTRDAPLTALPRLLPG